MSYLSKNPNDLETILNQIKEENWQRTENIFIELKKKEKITDFWETCYLDWMVMRLMENHFEDISNVAENYINRLVRLEEKGFYIDDYLHKYNQVMGYRISMKKYL